MRFHLAVASAIAAAVLTVSFANNVAAADRDIVACDNSKNWQRRGDGCTRLLHRRKWPHKVLHILYLQRGEGYSHLKQYERALEDYNLALRYKPNSAIAHSDRGDAYSSLGQFDRAAADAEKAVALDPHFVLGYITLGIALTYKHEYDRAIAVLSKGLTLDPKNIALYVNRSNAYSGKDELDLAIADLAGSFHGLFQPLQHVASEGRPRCCTRRLRTRDQAQS